MIIKINLKEKILGALKLHNSSYSELAKYLGITEDELDHKLESEHLDVNLLEDISKVLRIPFYSFFRDPNYKFNYDEVPYYNVDIWGENGVEFRTTLKKDSSGNISNDELQKLKNELMEKEKIIQELKKKLNQK
jgi:transcriptional regulator with XRE-family HTH domain